MHADAALSKPLLDRVFPGSRLTAEANLLVMPTLDAANITFNALKIVAGEGISVGPILLGAARPAHVLTPTSTVRRIVNMTALCAVDAERRRRAPRRTTCARRQAVERPAATDAMAAEAQHGHQQAPSRERRPSTTTNGTSTSTCRCSPRSWSASCSATSTRCSAAQMKPFGDAFIKLIKMLIAPIIFCTVVHGIASMEDMKKVGRVGVKALIYFEVMTTIALIIGLVVVNLWRPGAGMNVDAAALDTRGIATYTARAGQQSTVDFLMHVIPNTVVGAFAEGEILQVLLIAVLFAFALQALGRVRQAAARA